MTEAKFVMIILFYATVPALALFGLQLIVLRIRETRATPQDPHLGRKSLLYLFFNLAISTLLMGLTYAALEVCEHTVNPPAAPAVLPPFDWFSNRNRTAAALVLAGVGYALVFFALIRLFTNDVEFPAVRRAFAATRLAVALLIVMGASTIALVAVFQIDTDLQVISQTLAFALVWGPVAVLHLMLVLRGSGWRREHADR